MLYLDTGCLVKLYYPEWNSAQVAAAVTGEELAFTLLHNLELTSALELKVFRNEATPEQAAASRQALTDDLAAGKLVHLEVDWNAAWAEARAMACRSLDTLHCAIAKLTNASPLLTTDARQLALASATGVPVRSL